jgi:DNA-binding LytR/AlgR family response regulator
MEVSELLEEVDEKVLVVLSEEEKQELREKLKEIEKILDNMQNKITSSK